MSFDHLVIRDVEGERQFGRSALPLRVGTGSDCQIRLPGPGGEPLALLDLLDGLPFVQPVGRESTLEYNGEQLEASRRLQDGDELHYFGSRIRVNVGDTGVSVDVQLEDSAYVTKPPELEAASEQPEEEAIAPTAFRRRIDSILSTSSRGSNGLVI